MNHLGGGLRVHWWRVALVGAGLVVGVFASGASLYGVAPVVWWCSIARSRWTGMAAGVVLIVLHAWFVLPRELLGWSGAWAPSALEVYWLYPLLAAVVCVVGLMVERGPGTGSPVSRGLTIAAYLVSGFVLAALLAIDRMETKPFDEDVLPGPAGLRLVEGGGGCGTGNCWRELDATGDRAPEVMRAHLASRGFAPRSFAGGEHWCRSNGLVAVHEVCADLGEQTPSSVQVTWYVN